MMNEKEMMMKKLNAQNAQKRLSKKLTSQNKGMVKVTKKMPPKKCT